MDVDDTQLRQLREALLSAFPTRQDLEVMVFDQLHENLSTIARDGTLQYTTFDLIRWAQANSKLEELVMAALKGNGQNPQLRSVAERLGLSNDQLLPLTDKFQSQSDDQGSQRSLRAFLCHASEDKPR